MRKEEIKLGTGKKNPTKIKILSEQGYYLKHLCLRLIFVGLLVVVVNATLAT